MEVLDSYDFLKDRRQKDDAQWDEWLDGRIIKLTQGVDFLNTLRTFQVRVYQAAKARGLKVRTSITENSLIIQALQVTDRPPSLFQKVETPHVSDP